MMQKLKRLFTSWMIVSAIFAPLALPAMAAAATPTCTGNQTNIQGCEKLGACATTTTPNSACLKDPNEQINNLLTTIINVLSLVVGIVAVIMIIIGGIRFILSGGDSTNVAAARNTILYAIVGLVVVALAQVIVHFVLARVTT